MAPATIKVKKATALFETEAALAAQRIRLAPTDTRRHSDASIRSRSHREYNGYTRVRSGTAFVRASGR
jgi:hypothetical protein